MDGDGIIHGGAVQVFGAWWEEPKGGKTVHHGSVTARSIWWLLGVDTGSETSASFNSVYFNSSWEEDAT